MADCDKEGAFVYDPERFTRPICDSIDVRIEINIEELPDDDPLGNAAKRLPEKDDKRSED